MIVKFPVERPKRDLAATRPPTISPEIWRSIETATIAARNLKGRVGRFEVYEYLSAVYRQYRKWKRRQVSRQTARRIARHFEIPWRKGLSPLRVLIEASMPGADPKQKSRWTRALEYASSKGTSADGLR